MPLRDRLRSDDSASASRPCISGRTLASAAIHELRRVPGARTTAARRARQRASPDTASLRASTFSPSGRGRLRRGRSSRVRLPAATCRCRLHRRQMRSSRFHAPRVPKRRGAARFLRSDRQSRAARAPHAAAAIRPRFPRASPQIRHRRESRRAARAFPPSARRRTHLLGDAQSGRTAPAPPGVRLHRSARPSYFGPHPRAIRRVRAIAPQIRLPSQNLSSLVRRRCAPRVHPRIVRANVRARRTTQSS